MARFERDEPVFASAHMPKHAAVVEARREVYNHRYTWLVRPIYEYFYFVAHARL